MIVDEGICRIAAPICAVFAVQTIEFCGISTGLKELMVGGLRAIVGIGIVLPIRSSSLATSLPVLMSAGASPVALGVISGRSP